MYHSRIYIVATYTWIAKYPGDTFIQKSEFCTQNVWQDLPLLFFMYFSIIMLNCGYDIVAYYGHVAKFSEQ